MRLPWQLEFRPRHSAARERLLANSLLAGPSAWQSAGAAIQQQPDITNKQYTSSVEVVNVYACSLPVSIGTWPLAASACWPPSSNSCSGSQGPDSHIFAAVITTVVTHSNTRANIKPCSLLRHTLRAGLQAGFPEHRTYNFANFAELGLRTDEMNNFVLGKEGKSLASLHT